MNNDAKGNCYAYAYSMSQTDLGRRVLLCHGIATQSASPFAQMGHAWTEVNIAGEWHVRDGLFPLNLIPRDVYYRVGKIQCSTVVRYTPRQALSLCAANGNVGPWAEHVLTAAHTNE